MLVKDVEAYFGSVGDRLPIVKAFEGIRHRSAIYQWGEIVPLIAAREIEVMTKGELKVNYELYGKSGHAESKASA